ncbi:MAG TPA: cyclic peptide export ABC transporter [Thermoanaerobaculia bacterium]|jgi:putative ATP-binding cassette transporter|nr:cyclic peptide export ABC transporter [Thermoanaerobaculia bacterium]
MRDLVKLLSFLLRLSKGMPYSRLMMIGIIVAGVVSGLANTGMIGLINSLLTKGGATPSRLGWAFVGLCVALPVFRLISQVLLIHWSQRSLLGLRLQLCRRILAAPLRQLEGIGPHRLLAVVTTDISQIVEALVNLPLLFMHSAIFLSCLVYLGWLSWSVLLKVLGFIVLGVLTYQIPVRSAMGYLTRSRQRLDALLKHIRALTEGTKELKMHGFRREAFLSDVETSAKALQKENRQGGIIFSAASAWGQVLFFVVVGLLLFVLPRYQSLPSSVMIGFTLVLFHLMTPLEVLLNNFPNLGRAAVSVRTIERLGLSLSQADNEQDLTLPAPVVSGWNRLELRGIKHTYRAEGKGGESESFALGPIDLEFRAGELVFLVGGNGSGKTTLAKLLLGLYEPEEGEIRCDGQPVTGDTRGLYREGFSVVFSDFFLFERLLGLNKPVIDADARKYLEQLRLEQKVRIEEGVLSTLDLSQGQRKRLALLTAYLEDRPCYLFDEWAADQDPMFKEIFYLELLPELKARGKTVFVISHDDHYYHVADRVVKLDYGQVEYDRSIAEFLGQFVAAEAGGRGR